MPETDQCVPQAAPGPVPAGSGLFALRKVRDGHRRASWPTRLPWQIVFPPFHIRLDLRVFKELGAQFNDPPLHQGAEFGLPAGGDFTEDVDHRLDAPGFRRHDLDRPDPLDDGLGRYSRFGRPQPGCDADSLSAGCPRRHSSGDGPCPAVKAAAGMPGVAYLRLNCTGTTSSSRASVISAGMWGKGWARLIIFMTSRSNNR